MDEGDQARLPYGTGSPGEMAGQPSGLGNVLGAAYNWLGELAKRNIENAQTYSQTGQYDPGPALEAATLPMGTGAIAGVRGGGAVLGAGPIRRTPPPDVAAWFGQSKVRTPEGLPEVVYRGEHGEPVPGQQFQSKLSSLSFGDQEAANLYAMEPNDPRMRVQAPRVTPGHVKIENPIIVAKDDPYIELGHLEQKLGTAEARRIAEKFDPHIRNTNNWEENYAHKYNNVVELLQHEPEQLKNLYFDTYRYLDDPHEIELLKKHGFDGAIHLGNAGTRDTIEYRIFDPANWRSSIYGLGALTAGTLATQGQHNGR
jgi:hypothetical protein